MSQTPPPLQGHQGALARLLLLLFPLSLSFILAESASAKGWTVERKDDGIVVSTRSEPGRELPSFKGTGRVKANMWEILAILRDGPRRREWMTRSGVTATLKETGPWESVSYQQTLAPFPASDRDVVMRTRVFQREEPKELIATFDFHPWTKPIKGVDRDDFVLMPYLKGYWRMTYISAEETEVTYMVNTDPGGMLPNWLIKRISRDLPYWTLVGLRKQVKKDLSKYEPFLKKYDPRRAGDQVVAAPPPPPADVIQYMR
jgi:hypothetical protein